MRKVNIKPVGAIVLLSPQKQVNGMLFPSLDGLAEQN